MDDLISELEKTGAAELAGKFREAWKTHATALDTLKSEHAGNAKKLTAADKELSKLRGDLESAGKGVDERVTKLTKERDEQKTLAEKRAADHDTYRLRVELGDKLGITDKIARKRALDAFLTDYRPPEAGFDDKGQLQGFDKALDAFKKAEPLFFGSSEAPHGGNGSGSDPAPKIGAAGADQAAAQALVKQLYPNDFKGA